MPQTSQTFLSNSPEATKALGKILARSLQAGDSIGLTGELGAGKTQFVKGLAMGLGINENEVVSPSFGLINEYPGDKKLYHVDLYRLETIEEIETLGLTDYIFGDGICVIEWADRLGHEIDMVTIRIRMEILSGNRRRLMFSGKNLSVFEEVADSL